ncbi:hypothetical protein GCM10009850_119800 [Nonomuraea monospora]|uniref:Tat pathway signal sequence domain protein n=1 Tax=Nonomuraea monospora TaxID=568818 RepID=A0ABN3D3T0_9ACTN
MTDHAHRPSPAAAFTRRGFLLTSTAVAGGTLIPAWTAGAAAVAGPAAAALDTIIFGNTASESAHSLSQTFSSSAAGLIGQPARRLLPKNPAEVWGGTLSMRMAVDPALPVYVTVKLDGSEYAATAPGRLMLFCEGEQIGHYHLGAVDPLDIPGGYPRISGRFLYHTVPLPISLTQGKSSVVVQIRSMGRIYGGGTTAESYYYPLDQPTRAVYRLYTHTAPFLTLGSTDPQGPASLVRNAPARTSPGAEVLDALKTTLNSRLTSWMAGSSTDATRNLVLAIAYNTSWTSAYRNASAVTSVVAGLDALVAAHQADSTLVTGDWMGYGRAGRAITLLAAQLAPHLDQNLGSTTRRAAYATLMNAGREYWRQNRRSYTNQSMIVDLGIYYANQALTTLGSSLAWPESRALRYPREAIGLEPWRGPDRADGTSTLPLGSAHYVVTAAGLGKELGYVGNYGDEILGWAAEILAACGTAAVRDQFVKIAKARAPFRYPIRDDGGYRGMVHETVTGWRDNDYPGKTTYGGNSTATCSALLAAAVNDAALTGYAQQMLADGQFWRDVSAMRGNSRTDITLTLLAVPGQYATITGRAATGVVLPMTDGRPDFVFADVDNGVVAVKRGDERLYASLYWRARYAVNSFARIHLVTPVWERSATVRQNVRFTDSGQRYTVPNRVNFEFGNGGIAPPGGALTQGFAGEVLPVAKVPAGVTQPSVGTEHPFAGLGNFYHCEYGRYVIAMNATSGTTYQFTGPAGYTTATDLVTGATVSLTAAVSVGPRQTRVLLLP